MKFSEKAIFIILNKSVTEMAMKFTVAVKKISRCIKGKWQLAGAEWECRICTGYEEKVSWMGINIIFVLF